MGTYSVHSQTFWGKGRERKGERGEKEKGGDLRILGLLECAEGEGEEGAPVSQEEEEAARGHQHFSTLHNTEYCNTVRLELEGST